MPYLCAVQFFQSRMHLLITASWGKLKMVDMIEKGVRHKLLT